MMTWMYRPRNSDLSRLHHVTYRYAISSEVLHCTHRIFTPSVPGDDLSLDVCVAGADAGKGRAVHVARGDARQSDRAWSWLKVLHVAGFEGEAARFIQ